MLRVWGSLLFKDKFGGLSGLKGVRQRAAEEVQF